MRATSELGQPASRLHTSLSGVDPDEQDDVAQPSSMSRTSANIFLGELVKDGLCRIGYREITILDVDALAAIAYHSLLRQLLARP